MDEITGSRLDTTSNGTQIQTVIINNDEAIWHYTPSQISHIMLDVSKKQEILNRKESLTCVDNKQDNVETV